MTTPHDATNSPETLTELFGAPPPIDDESETARLFAEINERRARVENPEMLRHLRSL
jgi:hypothetical protein